MQHLVDKLAAYGWRLSTGIHGTNRLMLELVQEGHADIAYRLLHNRNIPSWGYMIEHGATTIWERWDSFTEEFGFQDRKMNSFNHYALGAIGEWLYRVVGGLNPDPEQPGFKNIIVRPVPGGGLTWAKAAYSSIRGRVAIAWRLQNGSLDLEVTVPPNTTATVYVPAGDRAGVTEKGRPLEEAIGVRYLRTEGDTVVVAVQSGTYLFCSESPVLAS
jgi:alpha-L-rhamnosidase